MIRSLLVMVSVALLVTACSSTRPISATSNAVSGSVGESCQKNILFIIPLETDSSIYSAAKKGGIKSISTVDAEYFTSIIYNSQCTVVRGSK